MPLPFAAKWVIATVGTWALGRLFSRDREQVSSQREPNEITSTGQASYPSVFPIGEYPVAGAEFYRGVEITTLTDAPFSAENPGKGRSLHLAFAIAEGAIESPTAVRIDEDLLAISQQGASSGPTIVSTGTTTDGGVRWNIRNTRGGRGQIYWYMRADGTQGKSLRDAADRMETGQLPFSEQHRANGISWVHIVLYQDAFANADGESAWPDQIPRFEFIVKGLKLPRVDTGVVEWTQNAADVRHWVETQFLGFPAERIDSASAMQARLLSARMVDLDSTTALGKVRFCYRLTSTTTSPNAPTGNSYPPGQSWSISVPEATTSSPYLWVSVQSYDDDDSEWGNWGAPKRLRTEVGSAGDGPTGITQASTRSRIALPFSRNIDDVGTSGGDFNFVINPREPEILDRFNGPTSRMELGPPDVEAELHEGAYRATSVSWAFTSGNEPQPLKSLVVNEGVAKLSLFRVAPNTARTACELDMTLSAELIPSLESARDAIELVRKRDGAKFKFHGPNFAENRVRDADNPYSWTTRNTWDDFANWIGEDTSGGYWLVLTTGEQDDDVIEIPPGIQPGEQDNPYIPLFNLDKNFQVYGVNGVITGEDFARASSLRNELDIAWAGRTVIDGGVMSFWPGHDPLPFSRFTSETGQTAYVRSSDSVNTKFNALTTTLNASRVHGFKRWAMNPLVDKDAFERDGILLQRDIGIRGFVTSPAQAEALLAMQLRQFRAQRVVTRVEEMSLSNLAIRPGQRIVLSDPDNGFTSVTGGPLGHQGNVSGRFMQVISRKVNPTDLTVEFDLIEHFNGTYDPNAFRFPQLEPDVSAPGVFVPDPSGLKVTASSDPGFGQDTTLRLVVEWNPVSGARTIVQWRKSTETTWGRPREVTVDGSGTEISPIKSGISWQVRIKHTSPSGFESAWSSPVTVNVSGIIDGPGCEAANVRLSAVIPTLTLRWTLPPAGCRPPLWRIQFGIPNATGVQWGVPAYVDGAELSHSISPSGVLAAIFGASSISNQIHARIQPALRDGTGVLVGGAAVATATIEPDEADDASSGSGAPLVISDLRASAGSGQVTLTWSKPSGFDSGRLSASDHFRIEQAPGTSGGSFTEVSRVLRGESTTKVISPLAAGTYRFRVRALTSALGLGPPSNVVVARPTTGPTVAPGAPRNVAASNGNPATSAITVTWAAPSSIGSGVGLTYRAELRREGETAASARKSSLTALTWTFGNLAQNTTYEVRVVAVTDQGETGSTWVSHTTAADTAPPTPPGPEPVTPTWGDWQFGSFEDVYSPSIGDVNIGTNAAEADGQILQWGTGGQWSGRGRNTGLTATGVMGVFTHPFGGSTGNQVIQVLQSGTSNANAIRRTDSGSWIPSVRIPYLFTGNLNNLRSASLAGFVDAIHMTSGTLQNGPPRVGAVRPIGFLRWKRSDSRGSGTQILLVLRVVEGFLATTVYTRTYTA